MNHYEVLGVVPDSEPGEIRKAYLAAARRYHPDFHADADAAVRAGNVFACQFHPEKSSAAGLELLACFVLS